MKLTSIKRQFTLSMFSQAYSQSVTIGAQLLVLPLMLWLWGAEHYGVWLLVSTLPTYLTMSDLGFAQVSGNDMTMRVSREDIDGAVVVNQTAWLMNACVSALLLVVSAAFALFFPIAHVFNVPQQLGEGIGLCAFLLACSVILSLTFGVVGSAMRAVGKYWLIISTHATARAFDALLLVGSAAAGGGLVSAAALMLTARVILFVTASALFYRHYGQFRPSIARADRRLLREMIAPSLSYMSYTVSNSVNIQGTSIIVGILLGPAAVVVVSSIRTLTGMGRMCASVVIHSLEPIFAHLAGLGARETQKRNFQFLIGAALAGCAVYGIGMFVWGEAFLAFWTRGVVVDQGALFRLMVMSSITEIIWFTLQTPYVSTNRHSVFAVYFLVFSIVSIVSLVVFLNLSSIVVVGIASLFLHLSTLIITLVLMRSNKAF
ncbi:lipopolysaccharide biosynthesis protein [Aliirhizobium smilacinae]|uniref:Lipopolysaccharide biosynthesis protein n=1 Tax=Aliirhizobium smilacinae TaxID=1395944 RepID=A0A5C4XQT7_9HYPH|nr:hypothetical protein [Rhizobium smilacinae]TNM65321.1 hypothetical protein FHP24_03325 [Rhizobium smilacinae]